ncbi:MAG: hypothetical protein R2751_17920 [Bacteroidales bacterium]
MKKTLWIPLVLILLALTVESSAQQTWRLRRYEGQVYLATTSMYGDIGLANKPFANLFNGVRPSAGFTARYALTRNIGAAVDLSYLMYGGKDEVGSSHGRVYSFMTNAFQHTARIEMYVLGQDVRYRSAAMYNRRGMVNNFNKLNMYLYAGLGGSLSKARIYDLNNDRAEPLTNPGYHPEMQYAVVFPVGAGLKWALDARWSMGTEFGYQFTLTDKLDGYAPVASQYNDSYYVISLRAIYKLRNDRRNMPIFNKLYR